MRLKTYDKLIEEGWVEETYTVEDEDNDNYDTVVTELVSPCGKWSLCEKLISHLGETVRVMPIGDKSYSVTIGEGYYGAKPKSCFEPIRNLPEWW
jgi:hypothetical protein